jgi:hypothetical protein
MSDERFEQIERQFAAMRAVGSPAELRGAVLGSVERELRAARWDRRLARVAAVLFGMGIGINVSSGLWSDGIGGGRLVRERRSETRPSLVDTAIVVAEATDAPTALRFARQMAALTGRKLTDGETAAIDAAVQRTAPQLGTNGDRG